jgi:hypothetical protein
MRLFTRLIVYAATALLLSAVLFHLTDAWFGENTSVLWAGRQLVWETRRSQALQARADMIARSLNLKQNIIAQLVSGQMRLRQAIVRFQRANEMIESHDLDLIPVYRTPTDAEGVARQVFIWACNAVSSWPPEKSQCLLASLENEFHTLFGGAKLVEAFPMQPMETNSTGRTEANSAAW